MVLYRWQQLGLRVLRRCIRSLNGGIPVCVNAPTGTGKTTIIELAFGEYIKKNIELFTIQCFISPRIRLCKQQKDDIVRFLKSNYNLEEGVDYEIVEINSSTGFSDIKNWKPTKKHTILVFCDESLWAKSIYKRDRFGDWIKKFNSLKNEGYLFGFCCFDEAHNFTNNVKNIFGKKNSISSVFKSVMLCSGTPDRVQSTLSKEYKNNVIGCSYREGFLYNLIKKPNGYFIKADIEYNFAYIVYHVLTHQINKRKNTKPVGIVNCTSIEHIHKAINGSLYITNKPQKFFKENVGSLFHIVVVHSKKGKLESMIDFMRPYDYLKKYNRRLLHKVGKTRSSLESVDLIEYIDNDLFNDDLPILIFQIGQIGEGINIKSCNFSIITTTSEVKATQQTGRSLRKFEDKSGNDLKGSVDIYFVQNNFSEIEDLLFKISKYGLTDECFSWVHKITIDGNNVRTSRINSEKLKKKYHRRKIYASNTELIEQVFNEDDIEDDKKPDVIKQENRTFTFLMESDMCFYKPRYINRILYSMRC